MFQNKSVNVHQFAQVPRADIPRSSFRMQKRLMTAFDSGYLVPIFCEEILPGDSFKLKATMFGRLTTPVAPIFDNLYLESFFFFVPNRLVWGHWREFMGQQANPGDSISFTVPVGTSPAGGFAIGSLGDYFGLPTVGQVGVGNVVTHNNLPGRAYMLIYNEWFRDENLINSQPWSNGDGPDGNFLAVIPLKRGKRHDYFTGSLPWTQKSATAVSLPLQGTASVIPATTHAIPTFWNITSNSNAQGLQRAAAGGSTAVNIVGGGAIGESLGWNAPNLVADLSTATATTINALRLAFQTQKLLERDARGGTRYTELVRSHFGVVSPDARLQRPEYLGGGSTPLAVSPVAQTSATGLTGGTTPQGGLAAFGTVLAQGHGFSQSFTEHGYVIGLVNVRTDLTYQQGMRRHWSRSTRYDFYWPAFATLGEQAVLNKEIYADGSANDALVFGYQERWAEYRYNPSEITGKLRSTASGTLDVWHLAQKFTALPTLNQTFIEESPPIARVQAVVNEPQIKLDCFYDIVAARPLPLYSVPGLMDHF